MKKLLALFVAALLVVCASLALAEPVAIKALILPKFESGEMAGDFPGEAQYYYEAYCDGGESYDVAGCPNPLYVKDGVALCVTGMGKVNSAMTLQAILMDDRFDFSNAYIISTFGRLISARPTASICCSPPESVPAICQLRSFRRGKRE